MSRQCRVRVWTEEVVIPVYLPAPPDKNPMFFETRVYQGSSGKVYPLPFTDRIAETKVDRRWTAVWLENEFLRVMVLPELGGRIHVAQDKTNGYDFIYRQNVIKPALVGLAGPWVSGGIEFNWPQHHRPATFLPADWRVAEHADGSKTVWCGDHDPMCRMKGMHGVCLHPGKAILELKVRAYNRTQFTQTFLWWANVATHVHEGYQSFFPPDVVSVADHAKRALSKYPFCNGTYYGVDYGGRGRKGIPAGEAPRQFVPLHAKDFKSAVGNSADAQARDKSRCRQSAMPDYPPNDLSWYANIPVPTSYMGMGSKEDFFGGYDHFKRAGIVHVANHHISPGKKQWTWGNHEFGYAWDRNLTDSDGPYIELMAGVFTDNQPDFSFLQPGETKTWSQFWYPIQKLGPAQRANLDAAVSLRACARNHADISFGVCVTQEIARAKIILSANGRILATHTCDLSPGAPFIQKIKLPRHTAETDLLLRVLDRNGKEIISYQPKSRAKGVIPPPAAEPPLPEDIASADELYLTGLHLEQYRHATRNPAPYWREALRRDPLDARCHNAMGLWHLRRGEFEPAGRHLRRAVERLTCRNPNPADGEPFYNLGLCLRHQLDSTSDSALRASLFDQAYAAFYKATWNQAWQAAGFHALAELDCRRGDWTIALEHLDRSLRFNTENLRARNLKVLVLRWLAEAGVQVVAGGTGVSRPDKLMKLELQREAGLLLRETLVLDPLDWWARHLAGEPAACDWQVRLDLAHDHARAGFYAEAIELLEARDSAGLKTNGKDAGGSSVNAALPDQNWGAAPLVQYPSAGCTSSSP